MPELESFRVGCCIELRQSVATGGAQRPGTRPLLVLFIQRAYSLFQTRRLWCCFAVGTGRARARMSGGWRSRRLRSGTWAGCRGEVGARRTSNFRETGAARPTATAIVVIATAGVVVVVQHLSRKPRQRQRQWTLVAPLPESSRLAGYQVLRPFVDKRGTWSRSIMVLVMPGNFAT